MKWGNIPHFKSSVCENDKTRQCFFETEKNVCIQIETGELREVHILAARGRVEWGEAGRGGVGSPRHPEARPRDGDHHGDRGRTNPPKDRLTEAKLTRDLRNANYTATQLKRDVNCANCVWQLRAPQKIGVRVRETKAMGPLGTFKNTCGVGGGGERVFARFLLTFVRFYLVTSKADIFHQLVIRTAGCWKRINWLESWALEKIKKTKLQANANTFRREHECRQVTWSIQFIQERRFRNWTSSSTVQVFIQTIYIYIKLQTFALQYV